MKLVVIIPTVGRKELLDFLLARLAQQTRPADSIVVSAPDSTHVTETPQAPNVSFVFGRTGLTCQRNRALERVLASFDIVTFFDDDFLPARDYLETVERIFRRRPDWTVVTGWVALDGVSNAGYTIQEGLEALARAEADKAGMRPRVIELVGAYGCNMSMRASDIGEQRFDERLVLYGWQEDVDFTRRVARGGRIVRTNELVGVHLGHKSGRLSGLQFGYSQIVNPVYLVRKGTMPRRHAMRLLWRNVAANTARSVWPESYVDRRGRLEGNLRGLSDVLRGRVEPERILQL